MKYRFADCEFDSESFALHRDGVFVQTTPQVLSILLFLLVSRPRLVTKDELVDEVWDGRAVSDAAITVRVRALRQAIGDTGAEQRLIKTIRGRGFRFVGEVEVEQQPEPQAVIEAPAEVEAASGLEPSTAIQPPSIAVQPFGLNDADGVYPVFATALPDEILTALSKLRSLTVIARGSSFQHPSFSVRPRTVREKLGADYSLAGQIDVDANSLRLLLELAETASEETIWRETYNVDVSEIHEVRADVVTNVAGQIEARISNNELMKARLQAPDHLSSWQSLHMGWGRLHALPLPRMDEADDFLTGAMQLDPGYARPHAALALSQYFRILWSATGDASEMIEQCLATAHQAIALDPYDPLSNLVLARALSNIGDSDGFEVYVQKSVEAAPSFALGLADLARVQAMKGRIDESRKTLARVATLDPMAIHPESVELTNLIIEIQTGQMSAALVRAQQLSRRDTLMINSCASILLTLHMASDADSANAFADRLKRRFSPARLKQFFSSVHQSMPGVKELIESAAKQHGLM